VCHDGAQVTRCQNTDEEDAPTGPLYGLGDKYTLAVRHWVARTAGHTHPRAHFALRTSQPQMTGTKRLAQEHGVHASTAETR